jgi:dephospho-CoA kinase
VYAHTRSEPDQELDRLMKRNGYTREEAESRIATQIPLAEKARLSDIVIDNSRSLAELRAQV